jgi:hypothetical protein
MPPLSIFFPCIYRPQPQRADRQRDTERDRDREKVRQTLILTQILLEPVTVPGRERRWKICVRAGHRGAESVEVKTITNPSYKELILC